MKSFVKSEPSSAKKRKSFPKSSEMSTKDTKDVYSLEEDGLEIIDMDVVEDGKQNEDEEEEEKIGMFTYIYLCLSEHTL